MMKDDSSKYDPDLFKFVINRDEVELLTDEQIRKNFQNSKILIIGAGGSIGSAIAKRLNHAKIEDVFILDRDESALHGLALHLSNISASKSKNYFIADIRDRQSIQEVLTYVRPSIVIHAAALKHLVILERFPREGYLSNIVGTLNVAQLCLENNVQQFINISTDKAARPSSVLGKTKKIAELATAEVFKNSELIQCSVRFGNVFASRGSVIETFIHQINNDLPVTISDLNVARFFMSQYEAANLVLAAASLKENGTYIQNMGQEILITEIVNRIATYLNKTPSIEITGLNKGEKMNEELFDAPFKTTKFNSILRSTYATNNGMIEDILSNEPSSNSDALEKIELLTKKYLEII